MKILFNCHTPFWLAHGGHVIQIQCTMDALRQNGIAAEPLRWWDERQSGDLIHHFGTAPMELIRQAQTRGIPLVMTTLFTAACNRPEARLRRQGRFIRTILKLPFGESIKQQLTWRSFGRCSLNVVGLEAERQVLELAYGVPRERTAVVPLGLDPVFLKAGHGPRDCDYLICTGTITERKNSVELAQLARAAKIPILFVGKPYRDNDSYWRRFESLVDGRFVKHAPHTDSKTEMVELLKSARGFVLMSQFENWCLSAHEAIACGLPLLVPDQAWSRERFGGKVCYWDRIGLSLENAQILKRFYDDAPGLPAPDIALHSWADVGAELKGVYEKILVR